ncbi:hypothetical protein NAE50_002234 [Salmonella enterica]|nr:hypothetical protein [Salmonella enterica]ELX2841821.1 hypothetical protein [Salmonella enterica]
MKTYIYSGPPSGATLNDGGKQREVLLWPGKPVALTPDHPYTLTLLAMGYLQEDVVDARTAAVRAGKASSVMEVNDAR